MFLKNEAKLECANSPNVTLKEIDTGYNSKYAYGKKLRKVALGRGNREGNNAFVADM